MNDIQKIFAFTTYIGQFKKMERFVGQFFWRDYPQEKRYDSNADHTWRMAMILTVIEPHLSKPINFKKAMTMLLIHDIPEIIAGDASPLGSDGTGNDSHAYNEEASNKKHTVEKEAALEIFGKLPKAQAEELNELWLAFENQDTFEAKVVKAIDKFEGKLQASEYRQGSWFKEHFAWSLAYGKDAFEADPALQELMEVLSADMEHNFKEYPSIKTNQR